MDHTSLAEVRKARGFTSQDALAGQIGVTRQAVNQWENGDNRPSGPARRQLALVLGVDLATVDGWFAAPAPQQTEQLVAEAVMPHSLPKSLAALDLLLDQVPAEVTR